MIDLPPFHVPRAPSESVGVSDWNAFLEAWQFILHSYLAASSEQFRLTLRTSPSLTTFLVSYLDELCTYRRETRSEYRIPSTLQRDCFSVIHRAWFTAGTPPAALLSASFLKRFCLVYGETTQASAALDRLWQEQNLGESQMMLKDKLSVQELLESRLQSNSSTTVVEQNLLETRAFVKTYSQYGKFLMVGAEFLDALISCWRRSPPTIQRKVTFVTYAALLSLAAGPHKSMSTLLDHLYTLRMDHEKATGARFSLLADVLGSTPFLPKYRRITSESSSGRAMDMLSVFEKTGIIPRVARKPASKGKAVAKTTVEDREIQDLAARSQIHELFPDLGLGYLSRLLDAYNNNAEEVISHLLEQSLPQHLLDAPQQESIEEYQTRKEQWSRPIPEAKPQRKNVFDNDAFDQLRVSTANLHIGKKPEENLLLQPLDKSLTFAALAAIDSDDDERDDTYDAEDVGGTVDIENPEHDQRDNIGVVAADHGLSEQVEQFLFRAWERDAESFSRGSAFRNSTLRKEMRDKTGWTDEQIEGWAIMLRREPRKVKKLREKFSADDDFSHRNTNEEETDSDVPVDSTMSSGRGRPAGRGYRGARGGRGRGAANVAGPANEASTQVARHRKDTNKSFRGNHNRRAQRAKKMAAGM